MVVSELFYYPYSGLNDERVNLFKQSLLLYDKICLLQAIAEDDERTLRDSTREEDELIYNRNLIEWIPPYEMIDAYDEELVKATQEDITLFKSLRELDEAHDWTIWEEKITNELSGKIPVLEELGSYNRLPFAEGEAILLNHAFFACDQRNLVPFTDDPLHHKLYSMKIERHMMSLFHDIEQVDEDKMKQSMGLDSFCRSILDTMVPIWSRPKSIPLQDLLEFRDNTEDNRRAFHDELDKIYQKYLGTDEELDIGDIIDERIVPELNNMHYEMQRLTSPSGIDTKRAALKTTALFIPVVGQISAMRDLADGVRKSRKFNKLKQQSFFYLLQLHDRFPFARPR